jgi:hypothetical protein
VKLKLVLLTLVILLSQVTPALAEVSSQKAGFRLIVNNRTGDETTLTLTGPTSVRVNLEVGKTTVHLEPGRYSYSYKACNGRTFTGVFYVTKSGDKLDLIRCSTDSRSAGVSTDGLKLVVVRNRSNETVTVTLSGKTNYTINAGAGEIVKVQVEYGRYEYSYRACGAPHTGVFKPGEQLVGVFYDPANTIEISKCQGAGGGGGGDNAGGAVKTVVLVIDNRTDGTLSFVFVGPQTYRISAPKGKTKLTLEKGTYQWTMQSNACGGYDTDSGNISLNRSSNWTWTCN